MAVLLFIGVVLMILAFPVGKGGGSGTAVFSKQKDSGAQVSELSGAGRLGSFRADSLRLPGGTEQRRRHRRGKRRIGEAAAAAAEPEPGLRGSGGQNSGNGGVGGGAGGSAAASGSADSSEENVPASAKGAGESAYEAQMEARVKGDSAACGRRGPGGCDDRAQILGGEGIAVDRNSSVSD